MTHKTEIKSDWALPADSHTPDWLSGINIIFHTSFIYYPPCCSAVIELTHSSTATEGFSTSQQGHRAVTGIKPVSFLLQDGLWSQEDTLTPQCDIDKFLKRADKKNDTWWFKPTLDLDAVLTVYVLQETVWVMKLDTFMNAVLGAVKWLFCLDASFIICHVLLLCWDIKIFHWIRDKWK